jgi:hypothetical protein
MVTVILRARRVVSSPTGGASGRKLEVMDGTWMRAIASASTLVIALGVSGPSRAGDPTYPVVDTGQVSCYDEQGGVIECPPRGHDLAGQDAQHAGHQPGYRGNGEGTVTDLVTGLMWQKAPTGGVSWDEAVAGASRVRTGGHTDWRLPTIKELYSLILFTGVTGRSAADSRPYLDTEHFDFSYGDEAVGERFIDTQCWSSTEYVGTTMEGNATVFGVNFADGRIKGYPKGMPGGRVVKKYVRYVRGNLRYGVNDFSHNGDGTVTDRATGLMWSRADSGQGMTWPEALAWVAARNRDSHLGYGDWRLPNAKELQSLVDYTRAPGVTGSAAIDPIFEATGLQDGEYPFFWTSTTHLDGRRPGSAAVYIAFGRALGFMRARGRVGGFRLLDVHGAGAQRSDPKTGDPDAFPHGRGPQGDVIRIFNFVRVVRDVEARRTLRSESASPVTPTHP